MQQTPSPLATITCIALLWTMPLLVCSQESGHEHERPFLLDRPLVKSIYFGGGSFYVGFTQAMELMDFLDSIPDLGFYQISLQSHTDSIGGMRYNQWLSEMRSQSVLRLLLLREDVREEMVVRDDFAYKAPVADNRSYHSRQANRRVDVIVWPPSF